MIKLVIFDLDGVLVEAKNIHFEAFNKALGEYAIMNVKVYLKNNLLIFGIINKNIL